MLPQEPTPPIVPPQNAQPNTVVQPVQPAVQSPKKSRKGLIITLISLGVLLVGGGVAALVLVLMNNGPWNDPQKFFTTMLDKEMQSSYVVRNGVMRSSYTDSDSIYDQTVEVKTDFSSPATPVSSWAAKQQLVENGKSGATVSEWEAVSSKSYTQYLRYSDFGTEKDQLTKLKLNQWYSASNANESKNLDQSGAVAEFNQTCSIVLLGDYSDSDRLLVTNAYTEENAYSFDEKNVKTGSVNGEDVSIYIVKVSGKGLTNVHIRAADLIGGKALTTSFVDTTAVFSISHKTGRLVKAEYAQSERWKGIDIKFTYTYAYPTELSITIPKDSAISISKAYAQ